MGPQLELALHGGGVGRRPCPEGCTHQPEWCIGGRKSGVTPFGRSQGLMAAYRPPSGLACLALCQFGFWSRGRVGGGLSVSGGRGSGAHSGPEMAEGEALWPGAWAAPC